MLRTWSSKACSTKYGPPSFHLPQCYHFGSVEGKLNLISLMGQQQTNLTSPRPSALLAGAEREANFMPRKGCFLPNPKLKFLDQCREVMRFRQLSHRTEETYIQWIRRYILFHRRPAAVTDAPLQKWVWRHPKDLGEAEVRAFLTDLAVTRHVGAATQNQAFHPVR